MLPFVRSSTVSALVSCLAVAVSACAVTEAPSSEVDSSSADLVGGTPDSGHRFAVGVCSGGVADEAAGTGACAAFKCSGTLIAPNLVVTARHCLYDIDYAAAWCDSTFSTRPLAKDAKVRITTSDSTIAGRPIWYGVSKVIVPATSGLCRDDVALLVLDSSVPRSAAYPASVDLDRDVAKRSPEEVAIVGRGVLDQTLDPATGAVTTGDEGGLRRRKLEHIPFTCASNSGEPGCTVVDYSSPPSNSFTAPSSYFVIGASALSGDSGSGVFDQKGFGFNPKLIGVTSAGTWGANGKTNFTLVNRIDIHKDLVKSALREARLTQSDDDGGR